MASRRSFTFGSLVLALGGVRAARAGEPSLGARDVPRFRWTTRARQADEVLSVDLTVENLETEALDVVVARGDLPGAWLMARIDVEGEELELAPIWEGGRRKLIVSRMGPIPRWAPLAAGKILELGPYHFAWPKGVPARTVVLTGALDTERATVEFTDRIEPEGRKQS